MRILLVLPAPSASPSPSPFPLIFPLPSSYHPLPFSYPSSFSFLYFPSSLHLSPLVSLPSFLSSPPLPILIPFSPLSLSSFFVFLPHCWSLPHLPSPLPHLISPLLLPPLLPHLSSPLSLLLPSLHSPFPPALPSPHLCPCREGNRGCIYLRVTKSPHMWVWRCGEKFLLVSPLCFLFLFMEGIC